MYYPSTSSPSAYTEQDVPSLQWFHVPQLKKLYEGATELSSIEWSHWSQIALSATTNRVIDHSDHTIWVDCTSYVGD
jgi:hypothetical protein